MRWNSSFKIGLKNYNVGVECPVASSCRQGHKYGDFIDKMSDQQLLRKDSAP
jgi:hypothetical protein